ncbi:MAG: DUF4136 domain-containing protein [Thermonemataceae bacterium]
MKRSIFWLYSLVLILLGTACSSRYTFSTDYKQGINFREYKTFSVIDYYKFKADVDPVLNSDINKARISDKLTNEFEQRGYQCVESSKNPDILVKFRTDVQTRQEFVQTNNMNNWGWYGWRYDPFPMVTTQEQIYDEMNFVIDVVDTNNNKTVWQGWAFKKLGKKREKVGEALTKIIDEMLVEYPVSVND